MKSYSDDYMRYLKDERRMSSNTVDAYSRDINEFTDYLEKERILDVKEIQKKMIISFMDKLRSDGRSQSTMGRKISSVRSYITYLYDRGLIDTNPSVGVKPRYSARKSVEFLSIEDMNRLLAAPDDTKKGIRDRAILELLYGTGIRVTELISMKVSEVNLTIGFVTCRGDYGKARIIPLGRPCRAALNKYIEVQEACRAMIKVNPAQDPIAENVPKYAKVYKVFTELYKANKDLYKQLGTIE